MLQTSNSRFKKDRKEKEIEIVVNESQLTNKRKIHKKMVSLKYCSNCRVSLKSGHGTDGVLEWGQLTEKSQYKLKRGKKAKKK